MDAKFQEMLNQHEHLQKEEDPNRLKVKNKTANLYQ